MGAAIALVIRQPILAIPLACLSHFALDALPHFGYDGAGFNELLKHRRTWIVESVNIVGVPLLIYLLWGQSLWLYAAAFAAILPDLMWVYHYFRYENKGLNPPSSRIIRFHYKIQWFERPSGIVAEFIFLILLVFLVVKLLP